MVAATLSKSNLWSHNVIKQALQWTTCAADRQTFFIYDGTGQTLFPSVESSAFAEASPTVSAAPAGLTAGLPKT